MAHYEPHFDIDFSRGKVGEDLVGTFLQALEGNLIEVKTDYRANETGNVYIEAAQKSVDGQFKPSGINTSQSDWWVIAGPSGDGFIAIKRSKLIELSKDSPKATQPIANEHTNASVGRIVKLADILAAIFKKG